MSVTPEPTVLVATEHENVVRIYAGHPRNGGVHQTGQFSTNRPIDPTDLANVALDMSTTFGWFAPPAPIAPVVDVSEHARAIKAPALPAMEGAAYPRDPTGKIPCPVPGCEMEVRADNLPRHLMTNQPGHNMTKTAAGIKAREARSRARLNALVDEAKPEPNTEPKGTTKQRGVQVWRQMTECPECGKVTTRNNMVQHLQSRQHGYTKERAAEVTRALPNTNKKPRGAQPNRVQRHGIAGARELETVYYPRVLALLDAAPGPMTAAEIASELNQHTTTVKSWMQRLFQSSRVTRLEPDNPNLPIQYAPIPKAPVTTVPIDVSMLNEEPTTEPNGTTQAVDGWPLPLYDVRSPQPVEERNPTT